MNVEDVPVEDVEIMNKFLVGVSCGKGLVFVFPPQPQQVISHDDALVLAAWLVALCGDFDRFDAILKRVLNS